MQGPVLLGLSRQNQELSLVSDTLVPIPMLQTLPKVHQVIASYECAHLAAPKALLG